MVEAIKKTTIITSVLNDFYFAPNGKTSLKSENKLVCFFGSSLMFINAIFSILSLHYLMNIDITKLWFDSLTLFIMGIIVLLTIPIFKNEMFKMRVLSAIFSAYLIFVSLQYYTYIGPAVWTIAVTLIVISLLYTNKFMLITAIISTILISEYIALLNIAFNNWRIFYQAEIVTMLVLSAIIVTIHKIIRKRVEIINIQFNDIIKVEEKLKLTFESVGDGVITIDEYGIIEFMNPIARELTGWSNDEAVGAPFENVFNIINENTREKTQNPVNLVYKTQKIVQLANHTLLISKDGTERAIEDTAAPIKDQNDKVIGCVLVFRDFSFKKEKQKEIEYLSYHDQLTGLYNRRFFEEELERLDTKRNLPLSIVFGDVNGLKIMNDAFGHEIGDKVIKCVGDAIKNECRSDDIVARIGGDEFVILLPKTDKDSSGELVERIISKIENRKIMDINVSISLGWDTKYEENQSALDIMKNAEDYMYQKKILSTSSKRNAITTSILNSLLNKSPREKAHSKRVSLICESIGKAYSLKEDDLLELKIAGELHDIGKIAIDESILSKTGKLSKSEFAQIKHHPETGYRLLSATSEFSSIADYVFEHHERWDGTGYPKGLKQDTIHWEARVIALADAFDYLISGKHYKRALSVEEAETAISEVKKNAGTHFDPDITRIFVEKVLGEVW